MTRTLAFDGSEFEYSWWNGERLRGTAEAPISFDSETERLRPSRSPLLDEDIDDVPLDPLHVPRPSLAMAFDGDRLVLIHPTKVATFFVVHKHSHLVGHNWQFDHWVCAKHCGKTAEETLWELGDGNKLHDSLILDLLLQLGTGKYRHPASFKGGDEARLYPVDLGTLSAELGCGELDKGDQYRLRFGELLGLTQEQMDAHAEAENFYAYALKDVIATWRVYQKQRVHGLELMRKVGWSPTPKKTFEIRPDAVEQFGVLSESLQVKASVVLAELSRTPLWIDQEKRTAMEEKAREQYLKCLEILLTMEPDLIRRYKIKERAGQVKKTLRSLLPKFDQKKLVTVLEAEAARLNCDVPTSGGKLRGTSTSAKVWQRFADRSPFITAWVELEKLAKMLEFLTALAAPRIWSRYNLMMMNGRTSAGVHRRRGENLLPGVNIQQMPRVTAEWSVRSLFLPPPGMLWFSCDYGYLELRTLAAVCRAQYGWSKLGDAIEEHTKRGGVDPHQRTAAAMLGVTVEQFLSLPKEQQKKARQASKPVNFGFGGGLGAAKFTQYAKASYGVDFTVKEAKEVKAKWLELYPELKLHLADRSVQAIEWQTGKKAPSMTWLQRKRLSDFLRSGEDGRKAFNAGELAVVWDRLEALAYAKGDEKIIADAEARQLTRDVRNLLTYRACTLTGRIRNLTGYTDNANTVFSGLAADGAKLAMWNLMRRGYKLLGFVHDSFEVAVDPRRAELQRKQIEKIMVDSMETVLGQGIPVAVEGVISKCWAKA